MLFSVTITSRTSSGGAGGTKVPNDPRRFGIPRANFAGICVIILGGGQRATVLGFLRAITPSFKSSSTWSAAPADGFSGDLAKISESKGKSSAADPDESVDESRDNVGLLIGSGPDDDPEVSAQRGISDHDLRVLPIVFGTRGGLQAFSAVVGAEFLFLLRSDD